MKALDPFRLPLVGTQLIEASAGTGKTHTITTLYLRLLIERRLTVEQILVVTFTKAATFELRSRIRRRVRHAFEVLEALVAGGTSDDPELMQLVAGQDLKACKKRLRVALATFDAAQIFTIHGFCQRILSEYAFESGVRFDLDLASDLRELLLELVQDFWTRELFDVSEGEVRYLKESKTDIGALLQVARLATSFPDLEVVPNMPEARPEDALHSWLEARSRFAEVWPKERAAVFSLLVDSEALSRTTFKPASVVSWLSQLDELSHTQGSSLHGWFEGLKNLTPQMLEKRTNKNKITPKNPVFAEIARLCEARTETQLALERWRLTFITRLVQFARLEFSRRKEQSGVQSFDDLLNQLQRALALDSSGSLASAILERYPAALIDEFQDTDPTQYAIFKRVYAPPKSTLFLIGDPKQAIYAFRGADIFAYLKAAKDAAPDTYTLTTNFRSDPGLISAVNTLFAGVTTPFIFEDIRYVEVTPRSGALDSLSRKGLRLAPLEVQYFTREDWNPAGAKPHEKLSKAWSKNRLPSLIAREIRAELGHGTQIAGRALVPGDIAVLTRTNQQARLVQAALRALRVPSVLHGDAPVFEAPEARELAFVLRAIAEPNSQRALRVALTTTLFGRTADDLWALEQDEAAWECWVEDFYRWNEVWQRRGVYQALRQILHEHGAHERILGLVDGERRLTNLLHLGELIHHQANARHLGISGTLQWFDEVRHDKAAREGMAPEAQQIRLESDAKAVQLTTLHRSKGLQYPVVYCPYLWDGKLFFNHELQQLLYHDPIAGDQLKLDIRAESEKAEAKEFAERERLAESLRLLYVGLTRAQHRVVITWGAFADSSASALGYLLHSRRGDSLATPASVAGHLKELTDVDMLAELAALAGLSEGNISVERARPGAASEYVPPERPSGLACARKFSRTLDTSFRSSSFSSLTKTSWARMSPGAEVGRDWDEEAPSSLSMGPSKGASMPLTLEHFPRGAQAGTLLHSMLEQLDFQQFSESSVELVTAPLLELQGLSLGKLGPMLNRGLAEVLQTPLQAPPSRLSLSQISSNHRLNELEFTLPVVGAEASGRLTPGRLGRALESAVKPNGAVPKDYPSNLGRLKFAPLEGFLRGFIDLVFEHEGLFYVVDYKSNYLGPKYQDYAAEALPAVMARHHYILQYHLYTLALHRYLTHTLRNYDYERNFGGVFYLFLRGMTPKNGATTGVFFDRPEVVAVAALNALLGAVNPLASGARA